MADDFTNPLIADTDGGGTLDGWEVDLDIFHLPSCFIFTKHWTIT